MRRVTAGASISRVLAGLAMILAPGAVQATERPVAVVSGGQRIAQRNCGGCHAVAVGASPLADAPSFRTLFQRYPPGGLDQILTEGMLRPRQMPEEGSPPRHSRMPMADLGDDEIAPLKAYLRSLAPRETAASRH